MAAMPPPHGFTLRNARPDEADAIGALVRDAYAELEAGYPADWPRYFAMVGEMTRHLAQAQVILAERDGVPVATVSFYPDGSKSQQGEWPQGWAGMLRLGVHPAWRRHGLARLLTLECVRRCREAGIETLALHTTDWMPAARALYERLGFVRDEGFDFKTRSGILGKGYRLTVESVIEPLSPLKAHPDLSIP